MPWLTGRWKPPQMLNDSMIWSDWAPRWFIKLGALKHHHHQIQAVLKYQISYINMYIYIYTYVIEWNIQLQQTSHVCHRINISASFISYLTVGSRATGLIARSLTSAHPLAFSYPGVLPWENRRKDAQTWLKCDLYSPRFAWGGRPHRRFISVRERG